MLKVQLCEFVLVNRELQNLKLITATRQDEAGVTWITVILKSAKYEWKQGRTKSPHSKLVIHLNYCGKQISP